MSNHFKSQVDEDICGSEISRMKRKLTDLMCQEICSNDISNVNTEEAGQIIDMIKDLAAAERYCAQATYYDTVVEAMGESELRMGYTPDEKYYYDDPYQKRMQYGIRSEEEIDPHYGKTFNEFRRAKRYYTETHSESDKRDMNDRANEHVMESMATIKEIWSAADPELRKHMKDSLTKLVSELA